MADKHDTPFFVGYLPVPKGLRAFLLVVALALVGFLTIAGLSIGATQDDPGKGAFRFDYGPQTVTGVIELLPYPILRVTQGNERISKGRTLMLTGQGKRSLKNRVAGLNGKLVTATGVILERGALDMMQLRGGQNGLRPAEGVAPKQHSESLGQWRLAGEICDGKCLAGAMRPGRGLAHKACANLCLLGDIPPVFVSSGPVDGDEFLMVVGPDGGPLPRAAYDFVAQYVTLQGEVRRHGDLLVLRLDPATIEVIP